MASNAFHDIMEHLFLLIRAGCPAIYLITHEEVWAFNCLARLCRVIRHEQPRKRLLSWCQGQGLSELLDLTPAPPPTDSSSWLGVPGLPVPVENGQLRNWNIFDALAALCSATDMTNADLSDCVVVFFDIHPYLNMSRVSGIGGDLVGPLHNAIDALHYYNNDCCAKGDTHAKTIVIISPSDKRLAPDLKRDFIRIKFPSEPGKATDAEAAVLWKPDPSDEKA